tara:strand:+ start:138 stop:716 length:579 start_codon:yes stop_codon:yes gene_type:complete
MAWYSETFIFLLAGSCMGAAMAILGAIGCFLLALFGKDEAVGEVRVGKIFNVKGVSLIMLSLCGVGLTAYCVHAWVSTHSGDSDFDPMLELGYFDEGEWDEGWDMLEDDDTDVEEAAEDDDNDVTDPVADAPTDVREAFADVPHYAAVDELGPPEDLGDDDTMDLSLLLRELEALEYAEDLMYDDDTEDDDE